MKFKHAFLIGVGGTGSHLVGPLVQLLQFHPDGTDEVAQGVVIRELFRCLKQKMETS